MRSKLILAFFMQLAASSAYASTVFLVPANLRILNSDIGDDGVDYSSVNAVIMHNNVTVQSAGATNSIVASSSVSATMSSGNATGASGGVLHYQFAIESAFNITIPIIIASQISVAANHSIDAQCYISRCGSFADAMASINIGDGIRGHSIAVNNGDDSLQSNKSDSGAYDDLLYLHTNTAYDMDLTVTIHTFATPGEVTRTAFGYALIDPTFMLTDGESAADYQFAFSDGIGNGLSQVPLPASAPMFGAALVALGTVGYGLKRKTAAAAA